MTIYWDGDDIATRKLLRLLKKHRTGDALPILKDALLASYMRGWQDGDTAPRIEVVDDE